MCICTRINQLLELTHLYNNSMSPSSDLVLDNLVSNNYLEVEYRALVREALLQRHCHHNNSQSSGLGLRRNTSQVHHGDDSSPVLSRQTSVSSEMRRNSSFSSLRPIKSLLNSLQLQQEAVAEDAEEGVANRHLKVCIIITVNSNRKICSYYYYKIIVTINIL